LVPERSEADAALLQLLTSIVAVRFGETSGFERDDVGGATHLHAESRFGSFHLALWLPQVA
jgi:hypothetical protein